MANQIGTFRQAWQTQVAAAIPSANVSGWFVDGVKLPRIMLVEDTVGSVQIVSDFKAQFARIRYTVVVEDAGTDGLSAAQRLDEFVSWDHANSVYAAMKANPTFGLTDAVVKDVDISQEWTVFADQMRAELPISVVLVKS